MNQMSNRNKYIFIVAISLVMLSGVIIYQKDKLFTHQEKFIEIKSQCQVQQQDCVIKNDGATFTIRSDKDVYYLKPFTMSLSTNNQTVTNVIVDFKMVNMEMGVNRTALKKEKTDWHGQVILPVCVTGRADWLAEIEVYSNDSQYRIMLPLEVKK